MSHDLFSVGQIRLAELSVYNWGSFGGEIHTARIDASGTLVTGDNGSGKSTFIDGLMALLLPAGRATFNVAAAQGDRSDRTLLSYMRGSFGAAHDGGSTRIKSKRERAVVTGLRALYQADDGSCVTLAVLFWTTQAGNALSNVKRIYMVGKRNLRLKEVLDAFGEGNARSLKQWLRKAPDITCCDENFTDYQTLYRKYLYMDNKNAPALLSRALGLKKIDDLTGLIRELVLEPSTVKDDARKVVDEFADLVAIHRQLTDARARKNHLIRLPGIKQTLEATEQCLEQFIAERNGLAAYFGEVSFQLLNTQIIHYQSIQQRLFLSIKQRAQQEEDADLLVEQRHEDYLRTGGGRIESLRKELSTTRAELERVTNRASRYQTAIGALGLNGRLQEAQFLSNQSQVSEQLALNQQQNHQAQNRFGELSGRYSDLQNQCKAIESEISDIEARPDSNIDIRYQRLRDQLVQSLELEPEQCVFLGELLDVEAQHNAWQGAIERALGGLRTTLAVPVDKFSMVTGWLNARHTGLHVRVQVVNRTGLRETATFKQDGFLKKLVWRVHPYRDWLKIQLARFDLHCVASTEELDCTPFSMTQQGLIHKEKGRFEKKDQHKIDNRRDWQTGFSNKSRLAMLRHDKKALEQQTSDSLKQVELARNALHDIKKQEGLWLKLRDYQWDEINAPYWQGRASSLSEELKALEQSGGDLEEAQQRWEQAKRELIAIRAEKEKYIKREGELLKTIRDAKSKRQAAKIAGKEGLDEPVRTLLNSRIGALQADDLDQMEALQHQHSKTIEQALDKWRDKKSSLEKSCIGIMSSFQSHDKWRVLAADWGRDIVSLDDYLEHLQQLENEGLPQLVEQFQERLNKHATQSLARIHQRLESERDDITERIDTINAVLIRTEFRTGSYLKLGVKSERYAHVQLFNREVSTVLSQATSDDHEARFQQLKAVVEILEKASNPSTATTLESLRLLDPRYQMSFYAEELDAKTEDVLDVLESSSGKSGGEKESFAGTIVAASLAYVLTPDGHDRPVYSTVFLDEAFSNTAEAVSRRVLRVFKALHIHVNLITPYKNLNLARESARSLLIAERNPETHESRLCEVTWKEIDRRLEKQRARQVKEDAQALGVEF
ncbi:MAG: ATP-binding protein [Pontibacterium sp.]